MDTSDIEYAALQSLAGGAATYDFPTDLPDSERFAARRVRHFMETWQHILQNGTHRTGLKASQGLVVTETATKENGAIVFVANPSETETVAGYVPPFLPDVTLAPRTVFAYVHDAPIGEPVPGGKFLASYVGLVKSDANILAAHIRPASFEGARLYVYGEPGETKEVVLFHGSERGQSVNVTFGDAPKVYDVAPSQVVALSTFHAGRTFFADNSDYVPVIIGADDVIEQSDEYATVCLAAEQSHLLFALAPDGAITEIAVTAPEPDCVAPDFDDSTWEAITLPDGGKHNGWYRAVVEMLDAGTGTLVVASSGDSVVYANGVRASSHRPSTVDTEIVAGRNVYAVYVGNGGIGNAVTLTVSGECFVIGITNWRYHPTKTNAETTTMRIVL